MPERRHIKYRAELVPPYNKEIRVTILEQTHRNRSFTESGSKFEYKGTTIASANHPAVGATLFFLRGRNESYDSAGMVFYDFSTYAKFKAAVIAYNEAHNGLV